MPPPIKVYAKKVWANVTEEQLAALNREVLLSETTVSDVMRAALAMYLAAPARKRRKR